MVFLFDAEQRVGNQIAWSGSRKFLSVGLPIAERKLGRICRFTYGAKQTGANFKGTATLMITIFDMKDLNKP